MNYLRNIIEYKYYITEVFYMAEDKRFNYKGVLKGILFSLAATIVLVLAVAVVCYFADVSDTVISFLLFLTSVLSVFLGGLFVAKNISQKGLLHGAALAIGYFIVMLCASMLMKKEFYISLHMIFILFGVIGAGMLGGIFGINSKK